jgi:hypothetical protein
MNHVTTPHIFFAYDETARVQFSREPPAENLLSIFANMSTDEEPPDTLITSNIFTRTSSSSTSTQDPHDDLISCLAVVQRLGLDLLPCTWQPALDPLGVGGTAEVRQLLINLQMSFAFKRFTTSMPEESRYRVLISEIKILCHPEIRNHKNIITLEGVCWDFVGCDKVSPVLVFEKTECGDMHQFLISDVGERICLEDRLKLCADVAAALMAMGSHGERLEPLLIRCTVTKSL